MLKNELINVLQLFKRLSEESPLTNFISSKIYNEKKNEIAKECERIKMVLSKLVFSTAKDHVIKRYIRYHQAGATRMADEVYKIMVPAPKQLLVSDQDQITVSTLFKVLLDELLGIITFITQYFDLYYDKDIKIPDAQRNSVLEDIHHSVLELNKILTESDTDKELKECISDYLFSFGLSDVVPAITYNTHFYVQEFTTLLTPVIKRESNNSQKISQAMIYLNFNYYRFLNWYKQNTEAKVNLLATKDERLLALLEELMMIKSTSIKLLSPYEKAVPSINYLIENWLNEEIKRETGNSVIHEHEMTNKIPVNLTVTQLALLIRLLNEEGAFNLKNITSILRFTAEHYTSKRQQHISQVSLGKAYYTANQFTAASVKILLVRMLSRINRMFFPSLVFYVLLTEFF